MHLYRTIYSLILGPLLLVSFIFIPLLLPCTLSNRLCLFCVQIKTFGYFCFCCRCCLNCGQNNWPSHRPEFSGEDNKILSCTYDSTSLAHPAYWELTRQECSSQNMLTCFKTGMNVIDKPSCHFYLVAPKMCYEGQIYIRFKRFLYIKWPVCT